VDFNGVGFWVKPSPSVLPSWDKERIDATIRTSRENFTEVVRSHVLFLVVELLEPFTFLFLGLEEHRLDNFPRLLVELFGANGLGVAGHNLIFNEVAITVHVSVKREILRNAREHEGDVLFPNVFTHALVDFS